MSGETRDLLLTVDEWLACETADLPPREGAVVIGIDLGGSASMTAAAFYWPATGRLECFGWFPASPSLLDRGACRWRWQSLCRNVEPGRADHLGHATVPVAPWLSEVMRLVEGETIAAPDRRPLQAIGIGRGDRPRRHSCPDRLARLWFPRRRRGLRPLQAGLFRWPREGPPVAVAPLAFADAVTLRDPANNMKLAKARSLGRIDAASASVLAVAEGARLSARPVKQARGAIWA